MLTHGKENYTSKKLGETLNKKQKYDESNLSLGFIEINYLLFCVLYNKAFLNHVMVPVDRAWRRHVMHSGYKFKAVFTQGGGVSTSLNPVPQAPAVYHFKTRV